MHLPLLQDILILLAISLLMVFTLNRFKIPSVIGFLLSGVIIGPYGLSLIRAVEEVEILSEIGVILLLFVIGMELSIKQLTSIRRTVFIGGFLQVGLTIALACGAALFLGFAWPQAVFMGFLLSLSSTAVVLKTLQDRGEISSAQGRNALAILIFQDIIVVPMMLISPLIAGESDNIGLSLLSLIGKSAIVLVITYISAKYLVPPLMHAVAKTNSKELFLLLTFTLCFAVAYLTSEIGLSLALGAFISGLIISESEYSHQATSVILPFRELFTSFFFVSVGMLLDLNFFGQHMLTIMGLVLAVFLVKSVVAGAAVALLGYPRRIVLLTGLALFQVGEFAFILSKVGLKYELLSASNNQYFLAVSILSMLITPFVIMHSHWLSGKVLHLLPKPQYAGDDLENENIDPELENHLVIIGYGLNGSNVAKAASANQIPYQIIEANPDTVKREKANGLPIIYGDAAEEHLLESVAIQRARVAVIAISNAEATRKVIRSVRSLSDSLYLIVRTRYVKETDELLALGADEVIPEEFETSVQIFAHVLQTFLVPEDNIERMVEEVRADNYELFKGDPKVPKTYRPKNISEFNIISLKVNADTSSMLGKSLRELDLRARFQINILGIKRDEEMMVGLSADEVLKQGDILYVLGPSSGIEDFHKLIK